MLYENFEYVISLERFNRYLKWSKNDRSKAIELYTINTQLSECLYTPIQTLEIVLRNRIDSILTEKYGENWFQTAKFSNCEKDQIDKAIGRLENSSKEMTPGRLIAELTFGFWTGLLGKRYDTLWQKLLYRIIFIESDRKGLNRKSFSALLTPIRKLRNRIAHHEPILTYNLKSHHSNILKLIGLVAPSAAAWCRDIDRFDQVHPEKKAVLLGIDAPY